MTSSKNNSLNSNSANAASVLVVDDHPSARQSMADVLRCAGYEVRTSGSAVEALSQLPDNHVDVIVTDLKMPGMNGVEFVRRLRQEKCDAQVVMVTAHASVETAVEAMRHGAFDYLEKPLSPEALERLVARALAQGESPHSQTTIPANSPQESDPVDPVGPADGGSAMIGTSEVMQRLRERIAQIAPTGETVLIAGESGTGKELVARSIHQRSSRADHAMVSLNCPVLSAQLMESELFGHERGAFTSADASRTGRFELADQGTILLDEITEIEPPLQAKLLRVLQERCFERIGSSQSVHVDVRVLATTNRDLRAEVESGRFREDLYFRLAVLTVHVPPLRERLSDVVVLADHFVKRTSNRTGRDPCEFESNAVNLMHEYRWPGNVRELENIVTRAGVLFPGKRVTAEDIRPWLIGIQSDGHGQETNGTAIAAGTSLEEMERRLIVATLEHYEGHRAKTAEALGIGLRTLTGKLRSYGLAPRAKSFADAA